MTQEVYGSTDDKRAENNTMRHQYRTLSDAEKEVVNDVKELGEQLGIMIHKMVDAKPESTRELNTALTNLEQGIMWAVKGITK